MYLSRAADYDWQGMLELLPAAGQSGQIRHVLLDLGITYEAQERWTEAKPVFEESLEIAREFGDHRSTISSLLHLGMVSAAQGHSETAADYLSHAVALAQKIFDPRLAKRLTETLSRISQG
jgi:tetratricopeptide (TPR) repeat protein